MYVVYSTLIRHKSVASRAFNVIKLRHQQGFQPLSGQEGTLLVVENPDSGGMILTLNLTASRAYGTP